MFCLELVDITEPTEMAEITSVDDLFLITQEPLTLVEYIAQGGKAIIGEKSLDHSMPLYINDPVPALARLMTRHPELKPKAYRAFYTVEI